jgi:hypothetical protein
MSPGGIAATVIMTLLAVAISVGLYVRSNFYDLKPACWINQSNPYSGCLAI